MKVGIAQITGEPGAVERNRLRCEQAVRRAAAEGARLVVLPELIVPGYTLDRDLLATAAEPADGPTSAAWRGLAAETGTIIVGGFAERSGGELFNSVLAVSADGIALHYRKLHLFGEEKRVFAPGDLGLPVAATPLGLIGVCVCYDLRFVEVLRLLALRGARIACVPSAWVSGFDARPDRRDRGCPQSDGALLQANLNQIFVACASQAGTSGPWTFLGSSVLADPTGAALAGPEARTGERVSVTPVDLGAVEHAQERGPGIHPRADRRDDVYAIRYEGVAY